MNIFKPAIIMILTRYRRFITPELIVLVLTEWAKLNGNKLTTTRVSYIAEWLGVEHDSKAKGQSDA